MRFQIHPLSDPFSAKGDFAGLRVDREVASRLRTSLEGLRQDDSRLADTFYRELFTRHPALRPMFPTDMSGQKQKLIDTLGWVVSNLDSPEEVRQAVEALGRRHVGYGAKPEHYPIVRDVLLWAMRQCAKGRWSDDLEADWSVAIDLLADMMLGRQHPTNQA